MSGKFSAGLFFLGLGLGAALPNLPIPSNAITPWIWVIFIIIGVVLIIKGN